MANSELQSPRLPLTFKFSEPPSGVDPLIYFRQELEHVVEYVNDHILTVRQEIEILNNKIP